MAEKQYSGYGYHGGGRKATGLKRVSFSVSCQPEQRKRIKELADKYKMKISEFIFESVNFYKKNH